MCIRDRDGDEGLFCAYDKVEFLAPVYAGDYIEAVGEITEVGNSSVSYTHLDVYKRQVSDILRTFAGTKDRGVEQW